MFLKVVPQATLGLGFIPLLSLVSLILSIYKFKGGMGGQRVGDRVGGTTDTKFS